METEIDLKALKEELADDRLASVIEKLLASTPAVDRTWRQTIYLLASRWRSLEKEQAQGTISREDHQVERNIITRDLLQLLGRLQSGSKQEEPADLLRQLCTAFTEARKLSHTASQLRAKNQISRQIGELLADHPSSWAELNLRDEAVANGICRKIIRLPTYEDLNWLRQITPHTKSHFTRGNITNALAELIYTGKLQLGDEQIVFDLLDQLDTDADPPLAANVDRVRVALKYVVGKNLRCRRR